MNSKIKVINIRKNGVGGCLDSEPLHQAIPEGHWNFLSVLSGSSLLVNSNPGTYMFMACLLTVA